MNEIRRTGQPNGCQSVAANSAFISLQKLWACTQCSVNGTENGAENGTERSKRKRKRKASGCRERVTIFFSLYNTLQVSLWNNNFNSIKLNNNSITTTTTTTKTNRDNSEKNSVRLIVRKQNKLRSVANRIESNQIWSDRVWVLSLFVKCNCKRESLFWSYKKIQIACKWKKSCA